MTPLPIDLEKIQAESPGAIIVEHELDGVMHRFAFARPKRTHIEMATSKGGKGFLTNMNNLCVTLLIAPERAHVINLFDYYPGLPITLGNKLLEAVGLGDPQIVPLAPTP